MNPICENSLLAGCIALTGCAAAPDTAEERRPNILICVADDATWLHFGAYGCEWVSTPAFDSVAARGILFENCYTPNAKSAPSRAVLLTGRYSWQLGEAGNHIGRFPADVGVFTEVLEAAGYEIAFTGKGWAPGDPGTRDGKPRRLTGKPFQRHKLEPPASGIAKTDYAANFDEFLAQRDRSKPWVFWYGSREPHRRYEYGSGAAKGGRDPQDVGRVPGFWPDCDTVRNDLLDYGFEIEHFDRHLGRMLARLEETGELDNTIVVVTADNGMPFPRAKGTQYEYAHHLPLAVMWPRGLLHPGRRIAEYVSFVDIAPTLLEAAGENPAACGMTPPEGASLLPLMQGRRDPAAAARSRVLLGRERHDYGRPGDRGYPIRGLLRDGWLYLVNLAPELLPGGNPETGYLDIDGSPTKSRILQLHRQGLDSRYYALSMAPRAAEELYRIAEDRECLHDRIADPACRERAAAMREELFEALRRQHDPRMTGHGDSFDAYPYDTPDKARFFERITSGEIVAPWEKTGWVDPTDYASYGNRR